MLKSLNEKMEGLLTVKETVELDEGIKTAGKQLRTRGWKYDNEAKSFKHDNHPGHEIVNWKNKLHHLKDNEHIATVSQLSKSNPHDDVLKYLTKTFGRKPKGKAA